MRQQLGGAALVLAALSGFAPGDTEAAADSVGSVTVLEGGAYLYRAAGRFQVVEGVRVAPGDILEVGEGGFLRVELDDRTDLQFGPKTSVMLDGTGPPRPERWLYLMRGWAKVASDRRDKAAPGTEVRCALDTVPSNQAVAVVDVTPDDTFIFVQAGELRVIDAHTPGASPGVQVKQGDLFHRKGGGWKGGIDHLAMAGFLTGVPVAFRDTLPPLAGRYNPREDRQPPPAPDFIYADVERWINAESPLRRQFVQRWRTKADNPAFRTSLVANLSAHPEWDPVLFPEKYRPKPDTEQLDRLLRRSAASAPQGAPAASK